METNRHTLNNLSMNKIYLVGRKGKGKYTLVDYEDYMRLKKYHWHISINTSGITYVSRTTKDNKKIYLHREILNPPDNYLIDHINMNGLDNRKENLRLATKQQNLVNSPKQRNNTSGYKGVYKCGYHWKAILGLNKQNIYLGCSKSKEEVARVYNLAASKQHKEFANIINV